jgi:hypothetical protein
MEQILDSLKKIIYRWLNTETAITENLPSGSNLIKVDRSTRFMPGDEVTITDGKEFEFPLVIDSIIDQNNILLKNETKFSWSSANAYIKKTIAGQLIQGIYVGDVSSIPKFPAVLINGSSKTSEWTTLESTTEKYEISITCYVESATQEDGYRSLLRMSNIIERGLKRNVFPVVGEIGPIDVIDSIDVCDYFIMVDDTDGMVKNQLLIIEDKFTAEDVSIEEVIDSQTIKLHKKVFNDYPIINDPRVLIVSRFLYNCWPKTISYTTVQKDTLLKGATISWTAEEIQLQGRIGWVDTPRN